MSIVDAWYNRQTSNQLEYLIMSIENDESEPEAEEFGLLAFQSTNVALKTERLLKDARISVAVIPTPVEITADCGIALLLKEELVAGAKELIEVAGFGGYTLVFPFKR